MLYVHHAKLVSPDRQIADGALLIEGQIIALGTTGEVTPPPGAREDVWIVVYN